MSASPRAEKLNIGSNNHGRKQKSNFSELEQKYGQICLYNHLYKTTTHLRWPMLSPPKPIPIQSLLYKMTTCLATFFVPQMKKNLSKKPLQSFIQQRNGKQCIKNKCLPDYIYSIATL